MNTLMMKKLILAPYTLKHYEPKLNTYFFCNACSGNLWKTDKTTGTVVATLDGTLTCKSIVELLHKNSPDIPINELQEYFCKTFKFLLEEGYICEYI